jgi:hypothetical protein
VADEKIKQLTSNSRLLFDMPDRLDSIGDEDAASSDWKTRIWLEDVRLTEEEGMLTGGMLGGIIPEPPRGTVFWVHPHRSSQIDHLWESQRTRR